MTTILNYLWRFWLIILAFVLTIILGIPVYILSLKKSTFKYAHGFIRIWCYGMFFGMGLRYELINLTDKKIDKNKQYVIISNHTSIMDIMLPCILFPNHQLCYVGKKELVKIPIFGTIYKRICVMVDRSSARSRADVYRRCAEKMEEGNSIVLFPEGGVPDDTSIVLDEFKDGAFTLSSKHHSPIAVFTFIGLKEMFPFDNSKGYPGKVKVFFNDILEPTSSPKELKLSAFETIKKTLTEHS
ncbi:lysophospholipid acyltransferase family protein [Chryseobacterium indoltheticum]|uniref:1-acyl-sn-glycerol-3-phosphate acyltransferase n=1 Tax=Chryseobacterium indoltheticum TaxID=254 RepID=A0A381JQH8_9FLAO|nr:lysophospholipid acyltransferase family protein [Chryseobacterium indoltheticum]AZA62382.1 1-acyl-sn-glycerol-3-phosphate acyltransferase [Chryseobacterium indoltheticum]AZA75569.1 1-acyl-sn-glycerol-3-phosphate acyltransferase [Chryseobacterium indoltheticum]QQQ27660.1 1-acyl-sn-glycerol-3-phosphate acyltransferase [Chryseobacterium indoltheticum]SIQ43142.1 1-acyl-sn-glycerol-3-phosphate acyltransferase [Chryseobacterium indoltheticum]SUX47905.1 putative acyltransferase [Chryseobacterium i